MENPLQKEFEYYVKNQMELAAQYPGKFLVIKDQKVIGDYDSQLEAYRAALSQFEPGTFLIHQAKQGDDNISQTFYSRIAI